MSHQRLSVPFSSGHGVKHPDDSTEHGGSYKAFSPLFIAAWSATRVQTAQSDVDVKCLCSFSPLFIAAWSATCLFQHTYFSPLSGRSLRSVEWDFLSVRFSSRHGVQRPFGTWLEQQAFEDIDFQSAFHRGMECNHFAPVQGLQMTARLFQSAFHRGMECNLVRNGLETKKSRGISFSPLFIAAWSATISGLRNLEFRLYVLSVRFSSRHGVQRVSIQHAATTMQPATFSPLFIAAWSATRENTRLLGKILPRSFQSAFHRGMECNPSH